MVIHSVDKERGGEEEEVNTSSVYLVTLTLGLIALFGAVGIVYYFRIWKKEAVPGGEGIEMLLSGRSEEKEEGEEEEEQRENKEDLCVSVDGETKDSDDGSDGEDI